MSMPPTPSSIRSSAGRMNRIRRWLLLGTIVPFGLLMGAATFQGLWGADETRRTVAIVILIVGSVVVLAFMTVVARGILREAAALDLERSRSTSSTARPDGQPWSTRLTGLGNHRAFQDELAFQLEEAQWQGAPLALLVFDVDGLKAVNDGNGHDAGDRLLAAVGQITAAIMRRGDRAFRVGGDEFAVILPNSDVEHRTRSRATDAHRGARGGDPSAPIEPFSLSIGVSAYPDPSPETHELYRHADAALYWCKRHGRTAVVAYDPSHHGDTATERPTAELAADVATVLAIGPSVRSTSRSSRWGPACRSASRVSSGRRTARRSVTRGPSSPRRSW